MDSESSLSAIERFISNLPEDKRAWGTDLFAEELLGIISQRLLSRIGGGLTMASEVLVTTAAVKSSIKDNNLGQLSSIIQTSKDEGMVNLDKSLMELVNVGEISKEDARKQALQPQSFS